MAIAMTESAATRLRELLTSEGISDGGLRVAVKGGGCSGLTYQMSIDNQTRQGDKVFDINGLKIYCDMKSLLYLNGTVLEYQNDFMHKGFVFQNPNSTGQCGCGESFSA